MLYWNIFYGTLLVLDLFLLTIAEEDLSEMIILASIGIVVAMWIFVAKINR